MIPGSFEYHRPDSVDGAVALLNEHGDEARLLAGGHSLIPMMKLRMAVPSHIVDLQAIESLHGISEEGGEIVIGALTTQHEVLASALLAGKCPILPEAAALIADPQVRYCGTIGGNVANGDPGNDMPAIMQALGATYRAVGPNGSRDIAARDYYEAAYFTALEENEVLTQIRIPTPAAGHGAAYEKQKRKIGDYATAAAAVILTMDGGRCSSASIALTNVAATPLYAEAAAAALVGTDLGEAAVDTAVRLAEEITEPTSDGRGPADFRTHVAGVMVRRAIARAQKNAG
ncbi:MAG: xanthine dehydrogenase family protein subunit M [Nisaea sp.]|jgi:carbon-monoxide dehydrogenase medium subunit|uniref:FAD binding domain-containing protein n=1 Tax=Nisaea sp. TaxID=2024842 RepID=UPI001B23C337|nr:xanthine dehydrogenase family protein subunit M [Nisaea sp.]MBO6561547.1 xanthine dehydrogenase family protein subunit M [Nisaea sp.]